MSKTSKMDKSISSRAIVYLFSKFLSQGINAISAFIFVRLLTTSDYGLVSVFTAWVSVFAVFIGLRVEASIQNARVHFGEEQLDAYCKSILLLSFTGIPIAVAICALFGPTLAEASGLPNWVLVIMLVNAFGTACTGIRSAYYTVKREASKDLVLSVCLSVLTIVISLVFVLSMDHDKYLGRVFGNAIPALAIGLVFVVLMFRKKGKFFNKEYWKFCLKLCLPMIAAGLATVVINQSDRIMLNMFMGSSETGIYSFAVNIAFPVNILWYSLNHAWTPEYYDYMKSGQMDEVQRHSKKYMFTFTILTCAYLMIFPEVYYILGVEAYYPGIQIVPLFIVYHYFYFCYAFPANYEFYRRNTKIVAIVFILTAILNLILNYALIPEYGMFGAQLGSCISMGCLFVIHDFAARFIIKGYHYSWLFYLKGLVPVAIFTAGAYLLMDIPLFRWIAAAVLLLVFTVNLVKTKELF